MMCLTIVKIKNTLEENMSLKPTEQGLKKLEDLPERNQKFMSELNENLTSWIEGYNILSKAAGDNFEIARKHRFLSFETLSLRLLKKIYQKLALIHVEAQQNFKKDITIAEKHMLTIELLKEEIVVTKQLLDNNERALHSLEEMAKILIE